MTLLVRRTVLRSALAALVTGAAILLSPPAVERLYAGQVQPCRCSASCFFQSCECSGTNCACLCRIFFVSCKCDPLPG